MNERAVDPYMERGKMEGGRRGKKQTTQRLLTFDPAFFSQTPTQSSVLIVHYQILSRSYGGWGMSFHNYISTMFSCETFEETIRPYKN